MKKKIQTFNDGIVHVYKSKENNSSFNAARNVQSINDLQFIVKLEFSEMYKREEDLNFAESLGRNLNLKIKTLMFKDIDSSCQAIINETLYSLIKIDFSKQEQCMYLYLEEERKLQNGKQYS